MKPFFVGAALLALAACNSQEADEPPPAPTPVALQPIEPSMPPPDDNAFVVAYAEACPNAKQVSTALCRSQGFGKQGFICDYGLGKDEYRRNTASVVPSDGKWTIAEPEKVCAADAA
jgi:hypothetical protein